MNQIRTILISGSVPTVNQLPLGDIAINTVDGKAYIKKLANTTQSIVELGTGGSSISASYASTASYAFFAVTASFAQNFNPSATASYALNALSSSYATTASYAVTAVSASYATNALSSSYASIATSASYALTAVSASYAQTATTASYSLNTVSASFASTASYINTLNQNVVINGNLDVVGTASFTYVTGSVVKVGSSTIILNTDYPAIRFGGITVIDSGSFGNSSTGSLLWDSLNNRWVYSNPSGSTYDGGLLISGPRNTSGLGNEQGTTLNAIMKGQGGDHITSSGMFEDSSGNIAIGATGSTLAKLEVVGNVYATSFTGSLFGTASNAVSSSFATTASYVLNAVSASFATTASYYKVFPYTGSALITGSLGITGSTSVNSGTLSVYKSGSTVVDIQGSQGQLFSIIDALSGSLMSVNDISGLPILEVFSDDRVVMGTYGAPGLVVSGSSIIATGSLFGTASYAVSSSLIFINDRSTTNVDYPLIFKGDTAALDNYRSLAADTAGPYYNPLRNTLGSVSGLIVSASSFSGPLTGSVLGTASYADNAKVFPYTGSAIISGSLTVEGNVTVNNAGTIDFNANTFNVNAPTFQVPSFALPYSPSANVRTVMYDAVSNILFVTSSLPGGGGSFTGSFSGSFTGSLLGTASYAVFALGAGTANNATSASYALSASYSTNALSSSYAVNASTASYVLNAVSASYSTNALSSSYALNATSASYSINALSSSYALSGSFTRFALTASYALNAADSVWTASGANIYYNQGNVGIGTNNPVVGLETYGGFNLYSNTNGHYLQATSVSSTDGTLQFRRAGGANGWTRLQLGSATKLSSDDSSGEVQLFTAFGGYFLTFYSNGSEALRVDTSQNIGIGTTSISARLHVKGSGTTSSTTGLLVQNSSNTPSFSVKDGIEATSATTGKFQVIAGNWTDSAAYTPTIWRTGSFASAKDIIIGSDGVLNSYSNRLNFVNYYFNGGQGPVSNFSGYIRTSIGNYTPVGGGQASGRGTLLLGVYDTDYNTTTLDSFDVISITKYATTISGSLTITGGVVTGSLFGTASYATFALGAGTANNATSASYALSSSYALVATTASYALTTTSASYSTNALSSSYALTTTTASYSINALSSSYALVATTASYASNALSSSYALSGSFSNFALTASYALNAGDSIWTGSGTDIYYNQGNVGIGVTNPVSRLQVNKSSQTYNSPTASGALVLSNLAGGNAVLDMGVDATNLSYLQSRYINNSSVYQLLLNPGGGNIGIGTTAANYTLDVAGVGNFRNIGAQLVLNGGFGAYEFATTTGNAFTISLSGTAERMRILSDGNIGINTLSPGDKLEVVGNVYADAFNSVGTLSRYNSTGGIAIAGLAGNPYAYISAYVNGGGAGKNLVLQPSSGSVGIGTTNPTATLEVSGNVKAVSFTGSFSGSINTAVSASYALSSSYALTATTASYALNALSSSYALSGSYSNFALTASYALNAADSVWTGSGTDIYYNQGNVGIGVTNPSERLHVSGAVRLNDVYFKSNNPASFPNFAIGNSNFTSTVTGYGNIAFGYEALSILTSGRYNVAAGYTALANVTTGQANVAVGPFALRQTTTGTYNIGIGDDALTNNINGSYNIGFGSSALENNINGEENIGIGEGAIQASRHGSYNIAMGYYALNYLTNTTSSYNIGIGYLSGGNLAGGIHNTYLGNNLHVVSTGSYNVFIGGNIAVNALGFSSATNTVVIADNSGNVKLLANSAGSVGIGTVNPAAKLHISGSTDATQRIIIDGSGNNSSLYLNYNGSNVGFINSYQNSELNIGTSVSAFVNFYTNNTERMRIAAAGNVGIGIVSPSAKLHVSGSGFYENGSLTVQAPIGYYGIGNPTLALTYAGSLYGSHLIGDAWNYIIDNPYSSTSQGGIELSTQGTTRLTVAKNGNVGIGTTNPSSALDAIVSSGATSGLRFRGYSDAGTPYLLSLGTYSYPDQFQIKSVNGLVTMGIVGNTGANPDLAFQTNTTERMRITTGGNVGIGTTGPAYKLDVYGSPRFYGDGNHMYARVSSGASNKDSYVAFNNTADRFYVGIPASSNSLHLQSGNGGTPVSLVADYTSGNVGIGTASPTQKLDVAGAISVSGSVIDYEVAPALIGPGPAVNIVSFVPGTTKAAFVDYVIVDSSGATNQRVGTIMVSISLNTVSAVMNEVTTLDIGNTSAITFAVAYGAPTWLTATNSGITPYDISYMVRYF